MHAARTASLARNGPPRPPSPNGKDARPSGNWGEPRAGAHARSSPPATARKPKHSTETAAPLASRRQNTNPLMTPPLVPAVDAPPKSGPRDATLFWRIVLQANP